MDSGQSTSLPTSWQILVGIGPKEKLFSSYNRKLRYLSHLVQVRRQPHHSFFKGISDSLVKLGKISLVNSLVKLGIKKTGCRKSAVVDEIYNNSVPKYIFILNVKPRSGKFWKSTTLKSNSFWFWSSKSHFWRMCFTIFIRNGPKFSKISLTTLIFLSLVKLGNVGIP